MNIREAIQMRHGTLDEDTVMLDKSWKAMVDSCKNDIPSAIAFIENECTVDDMTFLSEVFDELVYQTQNARLTTALCKAIGRYGEKDRRYFAQVLGESVDAFGGYRVKSAYNEAKDW